MSVLILDGHSPAAVEVVQSFGRAGVRVDVAAETAGALAFRSRYPRRRLIQPSSLDPAVFRDWLAELQRVGNHELVVPATEGSLVALRPLEGGDPLRRACVLPPGDALDVALDKDRTARLASSLGIPVPHGVVVQDPESAPEAALPVVLKPVRSKVRVGDRMVNVEALVARSDDERRDYLERWLPFVAVQQQEYVPGAGVGVELLFEAGRKRWHFAHERVHEWPLTGGASSYRRSVAPSPDALDAAERLLERLGWHGVAMVEFKRRADGSFVLLEINPRLWGSLALAVDAGVDFPGGLLRLARGEPVPPQPSYAIGRYARSLAVDARWMWTNLRADRDDRLLLTRPRLRSCVEYLRPLLGRESWDHFDWGDLGVTLAVLRQVARETARELSRPVRDGWLRGRLRRRHAHTLARAGGGSRSVRTVLFVCHGNVCRSPFVAALARSRLPGQEVTSGGFHPHAGRRTPSHVRRAAASLGVDLHDHASQPLSAAAVEAADLILLMDGANYRALAERFPRALGRATLLGLFAGNGTVEIADPADVGEEDARRLLASMLPAVSGLAAWLAGGEAP